MVIVKNSVRSRPPALARPRALAHLPFPRTGLVRCSVHRTHPCAADGVPTCNDRIPSRSHARRVARAWTLSAAALAAASESHSAIALYGAWGPFASHLASFPLRLREPPPAGPIALLRIASDWCTGGHRPRPGALRGRSYTRPRPITYHTETTRACALTRTIHTRRRLAHAHV